MADQHGSGPLTPGDPLGGGTPPPSPPSPPEPRREPPPGGDPAPPRESEPSHDPEPPREPGERWGLGGPPEPEPGAPGGLTGPPVDPPRAPERSPGPPLDPPRAPERSPGPPLDPPRAPERSPGPPLAPPAPDEPAARPGSFAPPGYGSSPVPPGAFAPPVASGAREPWVLAEWWRRAAAAIIDGVIVTVVALILLIPFAILGLSVDTDGGGAVAFGAGFLVFLLLLVVASFLYAPVLMARTNGQTLGKMATDIRVVRANGRAMDFGWAFLREVVIKSLVFGLVSSFTFGLASLLDWLWPLWDGENRALHDLIVDTRVVRA